MVQCKGLFLTATRIKRFFGKAVDNYSHTLEFVFDCYKTQKMCNKVVGSCLFLTL